jgi:diaminohydroxyphosphoribosylaminopyrimidine deaminase / 5-amino-6-(5-phosphoribosylamino)uracil reductase
MQLEQEHALGAPADRVWQALLALAHGPSRTDLARVAALAFAPGKGLVPVAAGGREAWFARDGEGRWQPAWALEGPARLLAELYLPVATAAPGRSYVVGHLGQSLDGFIATRSGDSDFVTGPENLDHLHRMRALSKAIVIGAGTVAADDPELTTRRVEGPNPVRVVLDPKRRLSGHHRVFRDRAAETWLVCADALAAGVAPPGVRVVGVPARHGELALETLLAQLCAAGLGTVFVEGGGDTVSRFLRADLLDRVQVAVAPLVIGEGRPGLRLEGRDVLAECMRLRSRAFVMGRDVLFDCEPPRAREAAPSLGVGLERVGSG